MPSDMRKLNPIEHVVIAGRGCTPQLTALFLQQKFARLTPKITLLECGENPDPPIFSCVSSIRSFHKELGIAEKDFILKTGAGIHLGSLYRFADRPDFFMCEAPYGVSLQSVRFNHWFLRYLHARQEAQFDDFCINAQLAKRGKFVPTSSKRESVYSQVCYGYKVLSDRYSQYLAQQVEARVSTIRDEILAVNPGPDGIESIQLKNGDVIAADLYIDCTRDQKLKKSIAEIKIPETQQAWSIEDAPQARSPIGPPHNTVTFGPSKLTLETEFAGKIYRMDVECTDGKLPEWLPIHAPWQQNCLTLGPATTNRPPLLIDPLHLAASGLYRLYDSWPTTKNLDTSAAIYNDNFIDEWNRIADSDSLHAWEACNKNNACLTAGAQHRLQIFTDNGKVPAYENETLMEDQWAALLFAFGISPAVADPLTEGVDEEWVVAQLNKLRETFRGAAEGAPGVDTFFQNEFAR